MKKYAVLTNDMQVAFANKHEERRDAVQNFLPGFLKFINSMRSHGIPIIHLQLVISDDDPRSKENYGPFPPLVEGSKGVQILPELWDEKDTIVVKNKDSGFFETDLDEKLKELGVDTLIISGMQTQICVQTTAADAHFRGYNVIVPPETVTSTRGEDTKRSLEWMESYCAKIIPSQEIISKFAQNEDI